MCKALADASNKIKWSVNLRPNLDNLPDTQIVRFSSVLPWSLAKKCIEPGTCFSSLCVPRSDKFRESVKLDLDAKQGELEAGTHKLFVEQLLGVLIWASGN